MKASNEVKQQFHCSECGSVEVRADAYAEWNPEEQEWELITTFDNTDCEDCGGECSITELPYEPDDEPAREFHEMSAKVYYLEATPEHRAQLRQEYVSVEAAT